MLAQAAAGCWGSRTVMSLAETKAGQLKPAVGAFTSYVNALRGGREAGRILP
jgi:hypothetical protein